MSESPTTYEPNRATIDRVEPRYASMSVEDGTCVVYDTQNHDAWIQADVATTREEVR